MNQLTTLSADANAIADIRERLQAAENAGDPDAAAAFLSDDVVLMVPDHPVQEGKAGCSAFLRDIMGWLSAHVHRHITYVSAEVMVIGDLAFDRGTFSFTVSPRSGGDSSCVTGKYLWLFRRTGAAPWRIARLIVSRDDPGNEESADQT
jgi:ketosteroid isomerase-like protein